ncbi:hypothetical protein [Wolbachia pipientis]|nr:hypothetical protein [Wolbachia pipientis]
MQEERNAYLDDLSGEKCKRIKPLTKNKLNRRGRKPRYGKMGMLFLFIAD